ncbi:MAG: hypothetical protein JXA03_06475 [Bacteroidales bacterium]|nr:hypothetical protein [Bacteroidales bacterium]
MKNRNRTIRWLARILGLLGVAFYVRFFLLKYEGNWVDAISGDFRSFALLMLFGVAGYVFAWFRDKEGGLVMLFSGMLMGLYLFYAGPRPPSFFTLVYGLPFMVPGVLFYYIGQQTSKEP